MECPESRASHPTLLLLSAVEMGVFHIVQHRSDRMGSLPKYPMELKGRFPVRTGESDDEDGEGGNHTVKTHGNYSGSKWLISDTLICLG